MIQLFQEDTGGGIESDDPPESKHVIKRDHNHWNLCDGNGWALYGLEESVSLMTAVPLLNTDKSEKSGFSNWLLISGDCAIVEGLIHETND
jgi:hypothetical protein